MGSKRASKSYTLSDRTKILITVTAHLGLNEDEEWALKRMVKHVKAGEMSPKALRTALKMMAQNGINRTSASSVERRSTPQTATAMPKE